MPSPLTPAVAWWVALVIQLVALPGVLLPVLPGLVLLPLGAGLWCWSVGWSQGWPALEAVGRVFNCKVVRDCWDRPVLLFRNAWNLNQLLEDHPELALSSVAPVVSGVEPIAL